MMTLDEMKLAVCEKLPELISLGASGKDTIWKNTLDEINWPTEGLQVCHEAEKVLNERERSRYDDTLANMQMSNIEDDVTSKTISATYEQRLEALCRVWFQERFNNK